ncbi:hypothetical protein P4H71_27640 [Paenibacillus kribbensis]|uniref:hypothetical protein n=1 Tax=Paenibacillus TaxID=44249 RepID=UPI0002D27827|nr:MULTISPECIES: hypothetical protein [Paenibacillus]MEC0238089.1 hypothetical protein [Paenibacillus kribbensis]
MNKFEKQLMKYLSYGFMAGLYYSFIKGPAQSSTVNGVTQFFTFPAPDFIFSALSTSFLASLIFGILYSLVFLIKKKS